MNELADAYDSEQFRAMGHEVIDLLADFLRDQDSRNVLHWKPPNEALADWPDASEFSSATQLFKRVLHDSISLYHPRYMGHQINPPLPATALAGLVTDVLNNGMGIYEMGMAGTLMERRVIELTARKYGFGPDADGFMTSGGTLANLTALIAARRIHQRKHPSDNDASFAVAVSTESHYCIDRAVKIMGWGEKGIVSIPVNDRYEIRTDLLARGIDGALADGRQVIAVVGMAGTTSTGSFDDLAAIGKICRERDLWFHVDGAHGAALAFSDRYRSRLNGIETADSVVLDFHKMLLVPAIISSVVFRNGRHSYETFRQQAEYLWDENPDNRSADDESEPEWYNLARRTFECTKTMMSLKVFTLLSTYGLDLVDRHVTDQVELAFRFSELIRARPHFEVPVDPAINIVCFRYVHPDLDRTANSRLNADIRQSLVEGGQFYIVQTMIDGSTWLRTTLTNPATTEPDLMALLDQIEDHMENWVADDV